MRRETLLKRICGEHFGGEWVPTQRNSLKELLPIRGKGAPRVPTGVGCSFELRGYGSFMSGVTGKVQRASDGVSGRLELRSAGEIAVQEISELWCATRGSWCGVSPRLVREGFLEGHSDFSRQKLQAQLNFLGLRKE